MTPRLRLRPDGQGGVLMVFDRMPELDTDEGRRTEWMSAMARLTASGFTVLRYAYEIELEDG